MADLSILDKLRFVASQQNQKKRNASSLLSLSQDSSASTQPVTTQLTRQVSDTTTHSQTIAIPIKPRQAKRVSAVVRFPVFAFEGNAPPQPTTFCVHSQTNPFRSDVPPPPADWSVFTAILDRIDAIKNAFEGAKVLKRTENSPVSSQRSDSLGFEDLMDSPNLSPVSLMSVPVFKSDVSIPVQDAVDEQHDASTFIPSYDATLKLSDVIESLPRPRPPAPKKARVIERDPIPRRSPRIEEMMTINLIQSQIDFQDPPPFTQTTSLLKRIKKAVHSSSIF
jgi:hypothetical protein